MTPEKIINNVPTSKLTSLLGWQGGTVWQVLEEIRAVFLFAPEKETKHYKQYSFPCGSLYVAKSDTRRSYIEQIDKHLAGYNAVTLID